MASLNYVDDIHSQEDAVNIMDGLPPRSYMLWTKERTSKEVVLVLTYKSQFNKFQIYHVPIILSGGKVLVQSEKLLVKHDSVNEFVNSRAYINKDFKLENSQAKLPESLLLERRDQVSQSTGERKSQNSSSSSNTTQQSPARRAQHPPPFAATRPAGSVSTRRFIKFDGYECCWVVCVPIFVMACLVLATETGNAREITAVGRQFEDEAYRMAVVSTERMRSVLQHLAENSDNPLELGAGRRFLDAWSQGVASARKELTSISASSGDVLSTQLTVNAVAFLSAVVVFVTLLWCGRCPTQRSGRSVRWSRNATVFSLLVCMGVGGIASVLHLVDFAVGVSNVQRISNAVYRTPELNPSCNALIQRGTVDPEAYEMPFGALPWDMDKLWLDDLLSNSASTATGSGDTTADTTDGVDTDVQEPTVTSEVHYDAVVRDIGADRMNITGIPPVDDQVNDTVDLGDMDALFPVEQVAEDINAPRSFAASFREDNTLYSSDTAATRTVGAESACEHPPCGAYNQQVDEDEQIGDDTSSRLGSPESPSILLSEEYIHGGDSDEGLSVSSKAIESVIDHPPTTSEDSLANGKEQEVHSIQDMSDPGRSSASDPQDNKETDRDEKQPSFSIFANAQENNIPVECSQTLHDALVRIANTDASLASEAAARLSELAKEPMIGVIDMESAAQRMWGSSDNIAQGYLSQMVLLLKETLEEFANMHPLLGDMYHLCVELVVTIHRGLLGSFVVPGSIAQFWLPSVPSLGRLVVAMLAAILFPLFGIFFVRGALCG